MNVGIEIVDIHNKVNLDEVELIRRNYVANGGWETFLSYEDPKQDILIGLLRLRKCSSTTFRPELTSCPTLLLENYMFMVALYRCTIEILLNFNIEAMVLY